jgi:hypothetical protein
MQSPSVTEMRICPFLSVSKGRVKKFRAPDASLMVMPSNEVVVYAISMDEISDDPDVPGVASNATVAAATTALQNAGIATEYFDAKI